MAVNLKLKKKCHIVPPAWLTVGKATFFLGRRVRIWNIPLFALIEYLQSRLAREISEKDSFSDLPFRFTEISKVLLDVCVPMSKLYVS